MTSQSESSFDILSIGTIYLDIDALDFPISQEMTIETETVGSKYMVGPGGSAFNLARMAAFLGRKPIFVGMVGDDEFGQMLEEKIRRSGVEPALTKSPIAQTNLGLNFINPAGQTMMAVVGSANQFLTVEEVMGQIEKYKGRFKVLYIGGFFKQTQLIPIFASLIQTLKPLGVKIALDHGRVTNLVTQENLTELREILPFVDYYLPSEREFLQCWDSQSVEEALKKARALTNAVIVVKQAAAGATLYATNEPVRLPAYPVNVINTIGAGDSFNAGFMSSILSGEDPLSATKFGIANAALTISQRQLPTKDAVLSLMQQSKPSIT